MSPRPDAEVSFTLKGWHKLALTIYFGAILIAVVVGWSL